MPDARMPDARLRQFLEDWVDAQDRLEEVLSVSPETWQLPFPLSLGTLLRDAMLLRFVFVYDLAWHTMQRWLYPDGIALERPRCVAAGITGRSGLKTRACG